MPTDQPAIVVGKDLKGVPFSKGLLAQSFMATGLAPSLAWGVAQAVQDEILAEGAKQISVDALRDISQSMLRAMAGPEQAKRYQRLRTWPPRPSAHRADRGTTGVGKSTVATNSPPGSASRAYRRRIPSAKSCVVYSPPT